MRTRIRVAASRFVVAAIRPSRIVGAFEWRGTTALAGSRRNHPTRSAPPPGQALPTRFRRQCRGSSPPRSPMARISESERFDIKIQKTATCWLWTSIICHKGYGRFWLKGKTITAHRYAFERWVGPIPDGFTIDHLCRVRNCVNPAHLEAVPHRENLMRGNTVVAACAAKTHCSAGHPLSGSNLRASSLREGKRICRICRNERHRRYMRERRARA